jgi:serine protease Do
MVMNKKQALVGGVGVGTAVALGWVGGTYVTRHAQPVLSSAPPSERASGARPMQSIPEARQVGGAFVSVAERMAPSVVRVTVREKAGSVDERSSSANPFEGTPFGHFFENFGDAHPSPVPRTGMGSGVVIDDKGHILTNQHVVAHADDLRVAFVDGNEFAAKIVGTDPKTDLAVIQVNGATVKPAVFGDSSQMHVGEWVIAIGNPFGLDHSVTVGVLSAKGRYGFAPGKLEDFLQTDASINPGNSGGPLVNLNGEIIGINTMIAGLGTGVGFAVSEAIARPIAEQLIANGKVTRPYIGIVMQTVTHDLSQAIGAGAPQKGAIVSELQKDSPAERAGIKAGDIVVKVGGNEVEDSRAVQRQVLEHKVGEKVPVTVWRDGKTLSLDVVTTELPGELAKPAEPQASAEGRLGLGLQTLAPNIADRLGVGRATRGALVASVKPGSVAADAGLQEGDIVVSVDGTTIGTASEAAAQLSKERPAGHFVRVLRHGSFLFFAIPSGPSGSG